MTKLPDNMKLAYIDAHRAYWGAVNDSTPDQLDTAIVNNESVAEDLLDTLLDLDFSAHYNEGELYTELTAERQDAYKQWVKDWNLPEPTGTRPTEDFYPEEHFN
jgi:DNA-binding LacI/PurR family transcriptional regulator